VVLYCLNYHFEDQKKKATQNKEKNIVADAIFLQLKVVKKTREYKRSAFHWPMLLPQPSLELSVICSVFLLFRW